jgi:trehalose 6-phosphate synthase
MARPRLFLISSPVSNEAGAFPQGAAEITRDIQLSLNATWIGWASSAAITPFAAIEFGTTVDRGCMSLSSVEMGVIRDHVNNGMLWPVLHGRPDIMRSDKKAFETLTAANRRLATALSRLVSQTDIVWVQDHLHIPLGRALRENGFGGPLGFMRHTPLPHVCQFSALPNYAQLIDALCCYDLIGFQSR